LSLFATSGGFAGLALSDIIGKLVEKGERGKFYAIREFAGNIAAFLGSLIVAKVFSPGKLIFPLNYTALLLIGSGGLLLASLGFWFIKEPPSKVTAEAKIGFFTYLKEVPRKLKNDPALLRFIIVENLTGFSLMVLPFYMIYAKDVLRVDKSFIGRYLLFMVVGAILSNVFWGLIAKQKGSKMVMRSCIFLGGLIPIIAMFISHLGPRFFSIVFLLIGFIQSGRKVGFDPYLLDLAPEDQRTVYLGIRGTLNFLQNDSNTP
jgi:Na+/melibiose symporter-like transporter